MSRRGPREKPPALGLRGRGFAGLVLAPAGGLTGALAGCGASPPPAVNLTSGAGSVFPIPGSRVASPQAQIVFRGLPVGQVGSVRVTGSRSGRHSGRLESDSDRDGGSFIPSRPFAPGERVTVTARLRRPRPDVLSF